MIFDVHYLLTQLITHFSGEDRRHKNYTGGKSPIINTMAKYSWRHALVLF